MTLGFKDISIKVCGKDSIPLLNIILIWTKCYIHNFKTIKNCFLFAFFVYTTRNRQRLS